MHKNLILTSDDKAINSSSGIYPKYLIKITCENTKLILKYLIVLYDWSKGNTKAVTDVIAFIGISIK